MECENGDHVAKLLKAQSHIWSHTFSFINSMSLKCAVDLGIPDAINTYGQPMPLSKLILSLPSIHPSKTCFIHRLMRILTLSRFFSIQKIDVTTQNDNGNDDEIEEYGYVLTDSSKLLIKDNPLSMTPYLLVALDPIMTNPWNQLANWFKNDDHTAFKTEHGMEFWEYAGHVPRFNHGFNDGMACDSQLVASVLIEKCKGVFEGLESLVDVGGGTGTMAKAIAKAFPKMECTVFDLPHVAALEGCQNLSFIGGDMFESIPPSDAILLKCILHDWNDEECLKILRKCKESIMSKGKKGTKVIIIDIVMMEDIQKEDYELVETQHFFDMEMMLLLTGKERTEKEWVKLFLSAGFSHYKITPIFGVKSLIEIYP